MARSMARVVAPQTRRRRKSAIPGTARIRSRLACGAVLVVNQRGDVVHVQAQREAKQQQHHHRHRQRHGQAAGIAHDVVQLLDQRPPAICR